MSKQLTPEEAQEITAERWRKRAEGIAALVNCGWCDFAKRDCEQQCPVFRIAGKTCVWIAEYACWSRAFGLAEKRETAGGVESWLDKHRNELIRAGHEILAEGKQ